MSAEELRSVAASLTATIHVTDVAPGVVSLDLLAVPEDARGRGHARDALTAIAEWADRTGTAVLVTATFGLGADIRRLVVLYVSFGFRPTEVTTLCEVRMRREPLSLVPAVNSHATAEPPARETSENTRAQS